MIVHNKHRYRFSSRLGFQSGMTLMEIMVAVTIFTIGILSVIGVFGNISKSIHVSRAQTLATNLAREKIESLKNYSYYRLLVTTSSIAAAEPGLGGFVYDTGYYPQESLNVGGINFMRRVYIEKVTENAGNLIPNAWSDIDTGMKAITCYVIWNEGPMWKKVVHSNVRDNPNRQKIDAKIQGTVTSGVPLKDVSVITLQNSNYTDMTDAAGAYRLSVPAGNYDIKVTKRGYFSQVSNNTVNANSTLIVDFALSAMGSGVVTGSAFINDRLLLTKVCASVDGDNTLEFVELYNPTDSPIVIFDGANPNYFIKSTEKSTLTSQVLNLLGTTRYVNTTVSPHGYYLLASSPVVNGVDADAYYSDAGLVNGVPDDRIRVEISAGIAILSNGYYEVLGSTVDAIGWGKLGASPFGPSNSRRGSGLHLLGGPGADGLALQESLQRKSFSTSTVVELSLIPLGIHANAGNSYDEKDNSIDWVQHVDANNDVPRNSSVQLDPPTGTPAVGGRIFLDDGLSSSALVINVPTEGYFSVPNVATGTWNILISSEGWVHTNPNVTVTNMATTDLGFVHLSTPATGGYISGRVTLSVGGPLAGIHVVASGGSDITDGSGNYWLSMDCGTYTVTANPNNENSLYTVGMSTAVVVTTGNLEIVPDIVLYQGGSFTGFISANGIDPLPGVPIIATNTAGVEVGSSVSDILGNFTFADLPIGNYTLTPQLEVGESATPPNLPVTVLSGSTVFAGTITVSNAFGTIAGKVQTAVDIIKTGVLLVAVPNSVVIAGLPPPLDDLLRTGVDVYYNGVSEADGTYNLSVRGGSTYNVYAWYTTFAGSTPNTVRKQGVISVQAGQTSNLDFNW